MIYRFVPAMALTIALCLATPAWCADHNAFAATKPTERIEYWQKRLKEIAIQLQDQSQLKSIRIVFLGDSITDFWGLADNPWFPGKKGGRAVWDESFSGQPVKNHAIDLGISGDRTEHVLYRLLPKTAGGLGELDSPELDPDFVVLMIGVNNSWDAEQPIVESIHAGIRTVVETVHECKPRAKVILQSLLPTNESARNADVVQPVNRRLEQMASGSPYSGYVAWLNLYPLFVDTKGQQLSTNFMDGVHPNEAGYRIWRDRLVPYLDALRSRQSR